MRDVLTLNVFEDTFAKRPTSMALVRSSELVDVFRMEDGQEDTDQQASKPFSSILELPFATTLGSRAEGSPERNRFIDPSSAIACSVSSEGVSIRPILPNF